MVPYDIMMLLDNTYTYILCYDTVQGKDKTMSCNDMIILYRRPLISDMVLLY